MPTDRTRRKVNELWNIISSSGLAASPHVAVEQIACLIMLKYLEFSGHDDSWSLLLGTSDPSRQLKIAFGNLREADSPTALNGHFTDAYFQLEAEKPEALSALLDSVDRVFVFNRELPFKSSTNGGAFDFLLSIASVGGNALAPTPRRVSRFMVSLLDPKPGNNLIDPAAGTGRMMVYAGRYQGTSKAGRRAGPCGIEVDKSVARIAWVNMLLNGVQRDHMHYGNSVSVIQDHVVRFGDALQGNQYDFVLSDLPSGNIDEAAYPKNAVYLPTQALSPTERVTKRLELLLIWRAIDLLKINGRAALILSDGALQGNTRAQRRVWRELLTAHEVEGVILLPKSSATVAILLFAKRSSTSDVIDSQITDQPYTQSVWFYEISKGWGADGYGDFYDALVQFRRQNSGIHTELDNRSYYEPAVDSHDNPNELIADAQPPLMAVKMESGRSQRHPVMVSRRSSSLTKQWRIPVREWAHKPEWRNQRGQIVGSHDDAGKVRAEYARAAEAELYVDGQLQPDLLIPNCIEAKNWSLDLNEYRWPHASHIPEGASTAQLIDELREIEYDILHRLDVLQALLEEKP